MEVADYVLHIVTYGTSEITDYWKRKKKSILWFTHEEIWTGFDCAHQLL